MYTGKRENRTVFTRSSFEKLFRPTLDQEKAAIVDEKEKEEKKDGCLLINTSD